MTSCSNAGVRQLTSWEEIPEPFRSFVLADRPLPYLIYSPPDSWGNLKVNARLTILSNTRISVLENTADGVQASVWFFDDLDNIEQGAMHLYSWLRLSGIVAGRPAVIRVEYNAAVAPLFTHVVRAVRQTWFGPIRAILEEEPGNLESLAAVDYKFWNFARESVLPGERVLITIYQPEITVPRFLVSRSRLTSAYVCVLTDKELIFVSDDSSNGDRGRYGVVRRYIPLTKIKELQIESATWDKTGVWQLQLAGERVSKHFSAPVQSSLYVLAALLEEAREKEAIRSERIIKGRRFNLE